MEQRLSPEIIKNDLVALNYGERYWQEDVYELEAYQNQTAPIYTYRVYALDMYQFAALTPDGADPLTDYMHDMIGASDETKLVHSIQVFEKYGGVLGQHLPSEILAAYNKGEIFWKNSSIYSQKQVVRNNLNRINRSYRLLESINYQSTFMHILLFVTLMAGLGFLVFQYTSIRHFLWAIIATVVIAIAMGFVAFFTDLMGIRDASHVVIPATWIVWWGIVSGVFGVKKSQKTGLKQVGMILIAMFTPLFPLFTVFSLDVLLDSHFSSPLFETDHSLQLFGHCSVVVAYIIWQVLYLRQLKELQSVPKRISRV